jgi:putative CocE/NonD family hydrolase
LDSDTLGDFLGNRVKVVLKGTRPVDEDRDGSMLAAAIQEHAGNGDVTALALDIEYKDDVSPGLGITLDEISPAGRLWEIQETGAPVYCYTGWFDASYLLSEINFYRSLETPDKRLIIGPWDHGGWQNISPYAKSRKPEFNHEAEALRFFDARLRGVDNGLDQEEPVAYYTMGEEKWKFTDTWPPLGTKNVPFYFSAAYDLSTTAPSTPEGYDTYQVDYSVGTGTRSRWVSLVNPLHKPIEYPDRKEQDEKLLCYTSAPLQAPLEVTGHPIVRLYISSTADDGAFFVYLEDVDPNGNVTYITEGVLRAIHRKQSPEEAPYRTPVPYRSFSREDAQPLVPGQVTELVFDLYPTSYQFKKGHSIRVALAGADKDHFAFVPEQPPTVRYYRSNAYPSHIDLPVMGMDPDALVSGCQK